MVYEVIFAGDFFLRHTFILFNMLMFTDIFSIKNKDQNDVIRLKI